MELKREKEGKVSTERKRGGSRTVFKSRHLFDMVNVSALSRVLVEHRAVPCYAAIL